MSFRELASRWAPTRIDYWLYEVEYAVFKLRCWFTPELVWCYHSNPEKPEYTRLWEKLSR